MSMNNTTKMKFVGGQEDGQFHFVDDCWDFVQFHEHLEPNNVPFVIGNNHASANVMRKAITYVRQGDVMVCEE